MLSVLEVFGEPISLGGQETYVLNQVSNMDLSRIHVDYLTPYYCDNGSIRKLADASGGKVVEFGLDFVPGGLRENIRQPLKRYLAESQYDVVHVHSGSTSVLSIVSEVAKGCGVNRVIAHSHATSYGLNLKTRIVRRVCGMKMRHNVDVYCACSRSAAEARFIPWAQHRAIILDNGINPDSFRYAAEKRLALRQENATQDCTVVVGQIGRLSTEKNQAFTLRVFKELQGMMPDSELWLVGDGPDREKIADAISQLDLNGKVRLLGSRHDMDRVLCGLDVLILPSIYEGFGIALLEAECVGLPAVISTGVPTDAILNHEYVRQLDLKSDPRLWATTILSLYGARNQRGYDEVASSRFNCVHSSARLEKIYLGME